MPQALILFPKHAISLFSKELSDGGGGKLLRLEFEDEKQLAKQLAQALKDYAAWSPICWAKDTRKASNFEAASIAAVDWELEHDRPFPRKLYQDPDRFVEFVKSLGTAGAPLPQFAHTTEHGVRLIWVLNRVITAPAEYQEVVHRLCLDFGGDISATGLAVGFTCGRHLANSQLMEIKDHVAS